MPFARVPAFSGALFCEIDCRLTRRETGSARLKVLQNLLFSKAFVKELIV